MSTASLRTALVSPGAAYRSCWVRVEQIMPEEAKQLASARDVYLLWLAAATGQSAVRLRPDGCPVEFDGKITRVFLGFFIWPAWPELQYSLSVALGRVGEARQVRRPREFSAIVDNADRYALPYYMSSLRIVWETPVYTPAGEAIEPPAWRLVDGIWIFFERAIFAAIRIYGIAHGASVVLEMEFEKGVVSRPLLPGEEEEWHTGPHGELILTPHPESKLDSHKIEHLKNAITVTTEECGGDGIKKGDVDQVMVTSEVHDVVIPECVKTALALCPGQYDKESVVCEQLPEKRIYYNACTGAYIGERTGDGGQSYCSKVVFAPESSPWLPQEGV